MDKKLQELAKSIVELQKEAARQTLQICKPEVERIISTNSRDINSIEHTLDALCDVAFDEEILLLFKKLCRYYYKIDPMATVSQIQSYREMWDDNDGDSTNKT